MPTTREIERKWIKGFKTCPLVDEEGRFMPELAHQLYYGKNGGYYPEGKPYNFKLIYESYSAMEKREALSTIIQFLNVLGIGITATVLNNHLSKFPNDYEKIIRMVNSVLREVAHLSVEVNLNNPYRNNVHEIHFLARVESTESLNLGQLTIFDEVELPKLYKQLSEIPDGYEDDEVAMELFRMVENTGDSFFITGKAGTGKSTFIHYLTANSEKTILKFAYTGIAAVIAGGQTLHSFFRFLLKPLLPGDDEIKKFSKGTPLYEMINRADLIVIDEVSMLRADVLEAVDHSLRINGGNPNLPFGGKQMLFVGDIFQLPPVAADRIEGLNFEQIYKSEYFFDAPAYKRLNPRFFEFTRSFRQKDDQGFIQLLDRVRLCDTDSDLLEKINSRYITSGGTSNEDFSVILCSINKVANEINAEKLRQLPFTEVSFEAKIEGTFQEGRYPCQKTLVLKKHAQVIFTKNDPEKRWFNGGLAIISFITADFIEVRLQNGEEHRIFPEVWENRRYKYENKKIVSECIGTFTQYPIKLAWAITIHKSQGLTLQNVEIDMGKGAFVNGQVYTALSRCREFDKIKLRTQIKASDIIADPRIINFYETEKVLSGVSFD